MTQTETLDIQAFFDNNRFSRYQWIVFGLCFCVVLLDGFDTAAIGYIAPSLLKEWGITKLALAGVLSAAMFGVAGGALLAGPLADRFGRRIVLLGSVVLFAVACLGSAFAGGLDELTTMRFITGLGLGAAMPNAITLMNEFCPSRRRSLLTNAMFSGFPLGAAFGGFLAAWMIPLWGWRSVLMLGGIAPLTLVVMMLFHLPESVRHMVARQVPVEKIRAILMRVSAAAAGASQFILVEPGRKAPAKAGFAAILSRGYLVGSVMMWVAYFMGLVIFYALINWMPLLMRDAGLAAKDATLVSALFPLGGVGAIFFGWLMDRGNGNRVIAIGYVLTAISIFAIGQAVSHVGMLTLLILVAGILMNTSQVSMPALAAGFYPTQGRATGVAWMLGVGRFGGIAGSVLVAELTRRELSLDHIFMVIAVPGAIAALALLVKQAAHPETASEHGVTVEEAHKHREEMQVTGH